MKSPLFSMLFYYDKFVNQKRVHSTFLGCGNKETILDTMRVAFPVICSYYDVDYVEDTTEDITNFAGFLLARREDLPEGTFGYRNENDLRWVRKIENGYIIVQTTLFETDMALFLKTEDRSLLKPL